MRARKQRAGPTDSRAGPDHPRRKVQSEQKLNTTRRRKLASRELELAVYDGAKLVGVVVGSDEQGFLVRDAKGRIRGSYSHSDCRHSCSAGRVVNAAAAALPNERPVGRYVLAVVRAVRIEVQTIEVALLGRAISPAAAWTRLSDIMRPEPDLSFWAECEKADERRRLDREQHSSRTASERSTPQVTIEAIIWDVRERGLAVLKELANAERLSRCDDAAKRQIRERIERMGVWDQGGGNEP